MTEDEFRQAYTQNPTPEPLRIEEGKWYRNRDGNIKGPAERNIDGSAYRWRIGGYVFTNDGRLVGGIKSNYDLIAEIPDPVESKAYDPTFGGAWVGGQETVGDTIYPPGLGPQPEKESGLLYGHPVDAEIPIGIGATIADPVNHPSHYNSHPSGVECIEITRHMTFNIGNAMKYLWRNGLKGTSPAIEDLRKAVWYINDEIKRLEK